ncbi:hypothetical protein BDW59DRAFT_161094 [Aspergillus cavernicola]|uniref:BZIP transcription factor n=1 Tax=Aspergillus cavernicola TaxID=176166 RepID=A0ABR4IHA3_9EURO
MSDIETTRRPSRNMTRSRKRAPRNISTLSTQQIQHKRDLDRKAQRALRQRVKSRMQDLEDDLTRAKADCSVRERQMMEELQLLRDENRKLRSYLDSIGQFAISAATEADRGPPLEESASPNPMEPAGDDDPALETDDQHALSRDQIDQERSIAVDDLLNQPQRAPSQGLDPHDELNQPGWTGEESVSHGATRGEGGQTTDVSLSQAETRQYLNIQGPRDKDGENVSEALHQPIVPSSHNVLAPAWPSPLNLAMYHQPSVATGIASVLPKHTAATCPLDQILLDFILSQRSLLAKGYNIQTILGPLQPSLQAILNPPPPSPEVHAASRVLGEVLTTFPLVALPEKLAFMFIMYRTLRWQISPADSSYEEMPRWLRPTATQITVPHAAWIDNIPWPRVRDILIEHPDKYPFAVFSELYSQNVTVNWPYEDMDCISTVTDTARFNPIFEKHVRKLDNWTVREPFKDYLPEMIPAIYGRD